MRSRWRPELADTPWRRADDRALAAHQLRHRMHGSMVPDSSAIVTPESPRPPACRRGASHNVLIARDELAEPHCLGVLMRHHQPPVAVLALQIDGSPGWCAGVTTFGLPFSAKWRFMFANFSPLHDRVTEAGG
jgi:hypothetical protein